MVQAPQPDSWKIGGSPALGTEPISRNRAEFYWYDGNRIEMYSEPELKQKIESEGRIGDDDLYVQAYRQLLIELANP